MKPKTAANLQEGEEFFSDFGDSLRVIGVKPRGRSYVRVAVKNLTNNRVRYIDYLIDAPIRMREGAGRR